MSFSYSRSNSTGGSNEIDLIDVAALVVYPFMAGFVFGVFSFSIDVFGSYELNHALWSGHGVEITVALLAFIAAIGWIVGTNEIDGSDYEQWEMAVMGFAILSVPMYVVIPAFESLLNSSDVLLFAVWLLTSASAVLVSYVE